MRSLLLRLPARAERVWIRAVIQLLPHAFREQNVRMASVGERHHWLYDVHSLQQLLTATDVLEQVLDPIAPAASTVSPLPMLFHLSIS